MDGGGGDIYHEENIYNSPLQLAELDSSESPPDISGWVNYPETTRYIFHTSRRISNWKYNQERNFWSREPEPGV